MQMEPVDLISANVSPNSPGSKDESISKPPESEFSVTVESQPEAFDNSTFAESMRIEKDLKTLDFPRELLEEFSESSGSTDAIFHQFVLGQTETVVPFNPVHRSETLDDAEIGLKMLPEQRMNMASKKGGNFTMMVVGESGIGKATFVNTLFATDLLEVNQRCENRYKYIDIHKACLYEKGFELNLTVITTPNFGDRIDNNFSWVPLCNFIDSQMRNYLFQEEQPDRSKLVDHRVHVCLYFISPCSHGIKPLDIISMRELSKRVNLIPVISKAEGYTEYEMRNLKYMVRQTLTKYDIHICRYLKDTELQSSISDQIPYSLIGAKGVYDTPEGKVRGRLYSWGIAKPDDNSHCDFSSLRDVLIRENMLDLIMSTEHHYENYRQEILKFRLYQERKTTEDLDAIEVQVKDQSFSVPEFEPDVDGINSLLPLSKINQATIEQIVVGADPIYLYQVDEIKKLMSHIVTTQDKKFKDWKTVLFGKQDAMNKEIESLQAKIGKLKDEIQSMTINSASTEYTSENSSSTSSEDSTESSASSEKAQAKHSKSKAFASKFSGLKSPPNPPPNSGTNSMATESSDNDINEEKKTKVNSPSADKTKGNRIASNFKMSMRGSKW